MDPLDFLTKEELIRFFHCKKTEMSCLENPHTFLNQLRDHNLLPEKLYQKVISMRCKERKKDGVYQILDWLEKQRPDSINSFWSCVFKDHILQRYPPLRLLRNSLLDGSFRFYENLPPPVDRTEKEKEPTAAQRKEPTAKEKKGGKKRKKSVDETEEEEEPGPSSLSTPKLKKPTNKPKFSSPVKKGEKAPVWTWGIYKTQLPVKCGTKEGTFYREKLATGGECILSQGRWFTPTGFEKFAGKERCRNWKLSIRCQDTPLQKLIEDGHLQPPRTKRRCVRKSQKVPITVSSPESSSSLSDSSREIEASGEEDQEELSGVEELEEREGDEEEENEDDAEDDEDETGPVDPSVFQAPSLPVSCGSVTGFFYKCRFASGLRGKSIRTEERWFTPEEFVKHGLNLTDGHWKKDIRCHGKTFNYLRKKKILEVHSLLCKCKLCGSKEQDQLVQDNDDVCFICNSVGDLLCCDECPRSFHLHCHLPVINDETLGDTWMCTYCVLKTYQRCWHNGHMTQRELLDSDITQYTVHCEYLLLCLYKEDMDHVFTEDPNRTIPRYSSVISKPMWLNRVKEKLQNKDYRTLIQFVSDIRLIFQNCHIFNKGNEFDKLGSRLGEVFEKAFHTIFNIQ
ncbi:sp110 nuclear body protein [Astyanax mexicanus]|uniref:sp110 nuclear body protein n=1 Tax=Astyanax mexicanus TaxID=7994 RepID=UPI0020CB4A18|nr:sp110 nuclear body protein [Astyanax mexicanus]